MQLPDVCPTLHCIPLVKCMQSARNVTFLLCSGMQQAPPAEVHVLEVPSEINEGMCTSFAFI